MRRITAPDALASYRAGHAAQLAGDHPLQCHRAKVGEAVAYTWTDDKGRPRAIAWLGRAQNPYSGRATKIGGPYFFDNPERRRAWVADLFARAARAAQRTATARAEKAVQRATPHALAVGDVLSCSWGYDQTNVEYFEVTRLIGTQMVEYRQIACETEATGHMTGVSVPVPGKYTGEPKRARVSEYGNRDSIRIYSFASAYKLKATVLPGGAKVYGASSWTAYA